jgi:adenylylsulfate kinase
MDRHEPGVVVWYTGLSGAGKSTIARAVHERLCGAGVASELLDGDAIRALMPTGFTRADREGHVKRVAFMASRLEHHGVTVHCALISPYAEVRRWAREQCRRFVEVYVSTPLAECERRDPKGLYAAARRGDIRQFTGIDDPYEPPEHPEVTIDTTGTPLEDAVARVVAAWERAR